MVFACSGNICRSPYAEAKAHSLGVNASSFGLTADGSSPADPMALTVGRARGINLTGHRSRSPEEVSLGPRDLVVAPEARQLTFLEGLPDRFFETEKRAAVAIYVFDGKAHLPPPM